MPCKVLKQKNDMSRCLRQELSWQRADTGSSQLKTQKRFLERCEGAPGCKAGRSREGAAEMPQHQAASLLLSPDSRSQGAEMWPVCMVD